MAHSKAKLVLTLLLILAAMSFLDPDDDDQPVDHITADITQTAPK